MQRHSQQDQDGVVWQTAGIPLGAAGLDLRNPNAPGALTKLLNARFRDEANLERRNGYASVALQDDSDFSSTPFSTATAPVGWCYGHGPVLTSLENERDDAHYPLPRQGRGLFRYNGTDIAWTGDRLLVVRDDGEPAIGASAHWSRGGESLPYGIPAYLPVQTDSTPPEAIYGDYVETCLTSTIRCYLASGAGNTVIAWIIDRSTNALLDRSVVTTGSSTIYDPKIISSAGQPVAVWREGTGLRFSWWSGEQWSTPSAIASGCDAHEVALTSDGFMLLWRESGDVKVARFIGHTTSNSPLTVATVLPLASTSGAMALAVAADDSFAVVYQTASDDHLWATCFDADASNDVTVEVSDQAGPWTGGLAASFRYLESEDGSSFVVHAGNGDLYTKIFEVAFANAGADLEVTQEETRYRTHVASKSFRVGDEVFCWLRARNSETHYLVAGVTRPQVCGIADREEAKSRAVNNDIRAIPMVQPDPLDEYAFTWVRPYTTSRVLTIDEETAKYSETYARSANSRTGDLQFLPDFCAVQFGKSSYLAGSLVRNWDGVDLGDAGFHDYPLTNGSPTTGGGLDSGSTYQYRVYAVRYNRLGERFQSAAITKAVATAFGDTRIILTINTVPCTNHDDVVFEVFRTEADGTAFYLEGTVANSLSAATVSFDSTMADSTLITKQGDPHAAGIAALSEVEEMGPMGCSLLAVAGDRLWGAGGQVPAGVVQFSKLKEPGEGAGFDALSGTQQIDVQGAPITSMIGFADAVIFFMEDGFQVITNSGPNNYGIGSFGVPQLFLADGATTHLGTIATPIGVVFWGADGPRLLAANFQVDQICAPIRELSKDLTPTGVQVDLSRQEVVWYTGSGEGLLWNFRAVESRFNQLTSLGRWAEWRLPAIAGCSTDALITTDGRVLYEDEDAYGDAGVPFTYAGATGNINPNQLLGGGTLIREVGWNGEYLGEHTLRVLVYFNGSSLWSDRWEWEPDATTGLQTGNDLGSLTGAQLDALNLVDKSGQYASNKRTSRQDCRNFRVEWTDISSLRPTYRLHELSFLIGSKGGLGRVPVNTFTTTIGR